MNTKQIHCENCKEKFIVKKYAITYRNGTVSYRFPSKKYCSRKCYDRQNYLKHYDYFRDYSKNKAWKWRTEISCSECGKLFLPNIKQQLRCSDACALAYKNRWKREKRIKQRSEKICPYCNKSFIPTNGHQKYCSKQCMTYAYQKSGGCKNPGFTGTQHTCAICDKQYEAYLPTQKYCSVKCRRTADYQKNRKRKMVAAAYRRALKKSVGGQFTLSDWEALKQEYNYCCVACGQAEPDIMLTIDHKLPLAKWHQWKEKLGIDYNGHTQQNIQPLCQLCNNMKRDKLISFPQMIIT